MDFIIYEACFTLISTNRLSWNFVLLIDTHKVIFGAGTFSLQINYFPGNLIPRNLIPRKKKNTKLVRLLFNFPRKNIFTINYQGKF